MATMVSRGFIARLRVNEGRDRPGDGLPDHGNSGHARSLRRHLVHLGRVRFGLAHLRVSQLGGSRFQGLPNRALEAEWAEREESACQPESRRRHAMVRRLRSRCGAPSRHAERDE